jgi:hypothetical protein
MKKITTAVLLAASALAHAAPPAPVGDLNVGLSEYAGAGPVGNNNLESSANLLWIYEGTGVWEGQTVQSWLVAWDPVRPGTVTGTVTFSQSVVAVLGSRQQLLDSAYLGLPSIAYDYNNLAIGLEYGDLTNTSFAGNVLTLGWTSAIPGDHARILTQVPEPGSWALMLGGLVAVGSLMRRRQGR